MNVEVGVKDLKAVVELAARAANVRSTLDQVGGLLLRAEEDWLRVSGTDLIVYLQGKVPAQVNRVGGCVVPQKAFAELAGALSGEHVRLEMDGAQLRIRSGRSKYTLNTWDEAMFPRPIGGEVLQRSTVDADLLAMMIGRSLFAACKDDTRPILDGGFLRAFDDRVSLVVLDAYRMVMGVSGPDASWGMITDREGTVVPSRTLAEMERVLKCADGEAVLEFGAGHIRCTAGSYVLSSRLLEGSYVEFCKHTTGEFPIEFTLNGREFHSALDRVCAILADRHDTVALVGAEGEGVTVTASSQTGDAVEHVEARECVGFPVRFGFSPDWMCDFLKRTGNADLRIRMQKGKMVLVEALGAPCAYTYALVPRTIQDSKTEQ